MSKVPLRIIEIDQHLVDLKRVQVVSPLDKGKFSLTMVSGIDAHCSDASMYEDVKKAYRDYMKWEQGLDAPSVTAEVGQVKPECKIRVKWYSEKYSSYFVGECHLANIFVNGQGRYIISFQFQLDQENALEMLQASYSSFKEAEKVANEAITSYYNRLFA